jgi:CBS domain-containing protein
MLRTDRDEVLYSPKSAPPSESLSPEAPTDGRNALQSPEPKVVRHASAGPTNRTTTAVRMQVPKDPLSIVASDLMTSPAFVVSKTDALSSVARRMLETGVNGMPVVDAAGVPIGMVSDGDLIGRRGDRRDDWWLEILAMRSAPGAGVPLPDLDTAVHEVMSSPLITVAHTASIKDIAEALQAHCVKRLPVLEQGRLVGVVSRADLLRVAESMPRPTPARVSGSSGFLDFLESMVGGASLRGVPERPAALHKDEPSKEKKPTPSILSAAAFREKVHAYKAQIAGQKQASKQEAQLERERQVKALLDQHTSDAVWHGLLQRAETVAANGEQELLLVRFPADLCSDGGRMIDVVEEGWEGTLRGEAAEICSRWRNDLKPQGFGLGARIVSYQENGVIGDIGLYLTWGS